MSNNDGGRHRGVQDDARRRIDRLIATDKLRGGPIENYPQAISGVTDALLAAKHQLMYPGAGTTTDSVADTFEIALRGMLRLLYSYRPEPVPTPESTPTVELPAVTIEPSPESGSPELDEMPTDSETTPARARAEAFFQDLCEKVADFDGPITAGPADPSVSLDNPPPRRRGRPPKNKETT